MSRRRIWVSNYPIIVLDGPDGVGKTTLAEAMVKELGAHHIHLTYRFKNKMFGYHTAAIYQALRWSKVKPVILDRWWMSEKVYADAYRGGTHYPLAHRLFEKVALKHAIAYVLCMPSDKEAYLKHYNDLKGRRVEMYDSGMEKVYEGFRQVLNRYWFKRLGIMQYDFMKDGHRLVDMAGIFGSLVDDYRSDQWGPALKFERMNFTGHIAQAKYLLVGDQLKPKTRREVWPFFEYANSSLWLAEALETVGIPEHELISINAYGAFDKRDNVLEMFLHDHGDRVKVIALGNRASIALSNLRHDHVRIHHPQYYRRFASDKGVELLQKTFAAINSGEILP